MLWTFNAVAMTVVVAAMVGNVALRYLELQRHAYVLSGIVFVVNLLALAARGRVRAGVVPLVVFLAGGVLPLMIALVDVNWRIALAGVVGMYAYCVVWWLSLEFQRDHAAAIRRYAVLHVYLGSLTAVIAIYQYFWSPDLLGLIPGRPFTDVDLIDQGFTKRATSLIGSPQNLGIYMAICCACAAVASTRKSFRLALWTLLVAGGMVSGSAAFVLSALLVVGAYGYRVARRSFVRKLAVGSMVVLLVGAVLYVQQIEDLRNTRASAFYFGNPLEERLPYLAELLTYRHPRELLFGHGLGTANRVSEVLVGEEFLPADWKPSESYVGTVIYETGWVGFLAFVVLFVTAVARCLSLRGTIPTAMFAILIALVGNLMATPSFTGLTMAAIAWPFVLIPLFAPKTLGDPRGGTAVSAGRRSETVYRAVARPVGRLRRAPAMR